MNIQGIIFDCDGTLVDSEGLAAQLISLLLAEQGIEMTSIDVLQRFRGVQFQRFVDDLQRAHRGLSTETLATQFRARSLPLFREQLKPVAGALDFVEALRIPACVASNGPRSKIETCLKSVGLHDAFKDAIISAYEVQAWKPDPNIMLHAAKALDLPAEQCLVVEDSLPGVEAGLSAGCHVAGFGETDFSRYQGLARFHHCRDYAALQRLIDQQPRVPRNLN